MQAIYTIGHSQHGWETFKASLAGASITALADVRSSPYSRHAQFNRTALTRELEKIGIGYHFFGHILGGRLKAGDDYETLAGTDIFQAALLAVEKLAAKTSLALMCAEHEPLNCHRFLLVARRLAERGNQVRHILRDGRIEEHKDTEARLVAVTKMKGDLLTPGRLEQAYRARARSLDGKSR